MKKLVLPTALAALVAAALVLLRPWSGERGTAAEPRPGATAPARPASGAAPEPLAGADTPVAERVAAGGDDAGSTRLGGWSGDARTLSGHVLLPAALPDDPTLAVLALRSRPTMAGVYGAQGVLARLARGTPPGGSSGEDLDAAWALAPVEADGTFRLPLPADATEAWLVVDGRFLFSREALAVALPPADGEPEPVELRPAVGAWITGSVSLPRGTAEADEVLAGASARLAPDSTQFAFVQAEPDDALFERASEVDADGAFELRGVEPGRAYELELDAAPLAGALVEGLEPAAGRRLVADVVLGQGARLRGIVLDEDGEPVAGARVTVRKSAIWGFPGRVLAETRCDGGGRFELPAVGAGRRLVVADLAGRLASEPRALELSDGQELGDLVLRLAAGGRIEGAVLLDGAPAAGVAVRVRFDPEAMMGIHALNAGRGAEGDAETGADGRFAVTGLGKGPFLVTAAVEADGERLVARRSGVRPGASLELALERAPLVRGRVLDAGGEPVPRFDVVCHNQGAAFWAPGTTVTRAFAPADGRFVLDELHEGSWELEVRAEGHGRSAALALSVPRPPEAPELEVVLRPAARVTGTVGDADGRPVPGARVSLLVEPERSFALLTGRVRVPEAYADAEGRFELEGLPSGSQALVASHPEHAQSAAVELELTAGETLADVLLVLRRGGAIAGEVYDEEGRPDAGTQVIVQNTTDWRAKMLRADADGRFRAERLTPGQWSVTAIGADAAPGGTGADVPADVSAFLAELRFTMAEVEDGEETVVVLGGAPSDPVELEGRVSGAGEPVGGAMISFLPDGAEGFGEMKFTQTDGDGRYAIVLERPGDYLVSVQALGEGGPTQQNNVEFDEQVPAGTRRLDLELPGGTVAGRVLGPDDEPLAGARVTLSTDGGVALGTLLGGQYAETTTDGDGRYLFRFVRPGTYSVSAGGALFAGAFGSRTTGGRRVVGDLRLAEGQFLDGVDFRLREPGRIEGVVRDAAGRPVGGASIFLYDESGRALERFSLTTTGEDGGFRYPGLEPGGYHVQARAGREAGSYGPLVRVSEGEAAEVLVTVVPSTVLRVRVVDAEGEPLRARVTVLDEAGRQVNGMLAYADLASGMRDGFSGAEQRVGPLPPGEYRVSAVAADGRESARPVSLSGQPERVLKLRLR